MRRVFTEFVRSLAAGESPDPSLVEALKKRTHRILRKEMRKRGLWGSSPNYLGIYGFRRWTDDGAMEELVQDVLVFLVDRLPSLQAQLRHKDNVEGFLFLGIRNFLYDAQKRHDPIGFRVFMVAQSAVRQRLEDAMLHVLASNPRVSNDTILGFEPDGDPQAAPVDLDVYVKAWNNELMPELVTARGKHTDEVIRRLAVLLSGLQNMA